MNPRFDGGRIAAGAGAIALHGVVLMLVLVPMKLPPIVADAVRLPDIQWIPREEPKPVEVVPFKPDPVPTPTPVTITPPTPATAPVDTVTPVVDPMPGDTAVVPVARVTGAAVASTEPVAVMTGVALRYAVAPPPPYPASALRKGLEGTVLLEVLVDTDGRPMEVTVSRSSGHRELDRAAQRHVLERWRFQPALRDGRPVQAIGLVPIGFALR
ncbi:MAG: energy transducer TonB [Lysobacter sp.]